MKADTKDLIDKARRSLSAAESLLSDGHFDFAASRAYYAMFYVSEALLLEKGKSFSKHSAVIAAIYEYFVRDGTLPKEFHKVLCKSFDLRNDGDYLCGKPLEKREVEAMLAGIKEQIGVGIDMLAKYLI